MKLKLTLAILAGLVTAAFAQNPAPELGSSFSPDGLYDIGKTGDLRPGFINAAKGITVGAPGAGPGGSTYTPVNGAVNLGDGTVTQITSITTGVTVNAVTGVITTVSSSLAAVTSTSFVVTDSACAATSAVQVTLDNYSGTYVTNGIPLITVQGVSAGSFTVVITNVHATNALSGVLKIAYAIL